MAMLEEHFMSLGKSWCPKKSSAASVEVPKESAASHKSNAKGASKPSEDASKRTEAIINSLQKADSSRPSQRKGSTNARDAVSTDKNSQDAASGNIIALVTAAAAKKDDQEVASKPSSPDIFSPASADVTVSGSAPDASTNVRGAKGKSREVKKKKTSAAADATETNRLQKTCHTKRQELEAAESELLETQMEVQQLERQIQDALDAKRVREACEAKQRELAQAQDEFKQTQAEVQELENRLREAQKQQAQKAAVSKPTRQNAAGKDRSLKSKVSDASAPETTSRTLKPSHSNSVETYPQSPTKHHSTGEEDLLPSPALSPTKVALRNNIFSLVIAAASAAKAQSAQSVQRRRQDDPFDLLL
jgi:DNA repair exonuclease SbcCD ATPase subunit